MGLRHYLCIIWQWNMFEIPNDLAQQINFIYIAKANVNNSSTLTHQINLHMLKNKCHMIRSLQTEFHIILIKPNITAQKRVQSHYFLYVLHISKLNCLVLLKTLPSRWPPAKYPRDYFNANKTPFHQCYFIAQCALDTSIYRMTARWSTKSMF